MKKVLYLFLTVSIIFSSCKKEEEIIEPTVINGCMNAIASNYDATANTDDGSCIFGIVGGAWNATSELEEGSILVTYMGANIMDSTWSETRTDSLGLARLEFNSNLTFESTELDGLITSGDWLQNNDQLTLTEDSAGIELELGTLTIVSVNETNLAMSMSFSETEEQNGYVSSYQINVTFNFARDLSGFTTNTTNQRKGYSKWFNKVELINSIKHN
tara:strand:+ start:259 stop:906 length:648 start_codon:yes stop_codon:yes gene_type:complete